MSGSYQTAVRDRVKKAFAPVPGCMHADREPERTRAAQCEAEEKSDQSSAQCAHPSFSRIAQM